MPVITHSVLSGDPRHAGLYEEPGENLPQVTTVVIPTLSDKKQNRFSNLTFTSSLCNDNAVMVRYMHVLICLRVSYKCHCCHPKKS